MFCYKNIIFPVKDITAFFSDLCRPFEVTFRPINFMIMLCIFFRKYFYSISLSLVMALSYILKLSKKKKGKLHKKNFLCIVGSSLNFSEFVLQF